MGMATSCPSVVISREASGVVAMEIAVDRGVDVRLLFHGRAPERSRGLSTTARNRHERSESHKKE
jgi:hypothetical protein